VAKILLVDDDDSNRVTLSVLLEDEGYAVDVEGSFEGAKKRLGSADGYDLLLLDQHLGDGLGSDLVPLVRQRWPAAKVLLISGSISDRSGMAELFDALVPKGAAFPDVLALVQRVLANP
jgi:two-component system response regulator RegA